VEIHTTLTAVIEELKDYGNIFQCHRSFVVNVNNITSAKGNSNGYQLKLGSCANIIPVSRSYVPRLKSFIA
jgi:DNA-binding LytR/AlgR family response regulator